MSPGLRVSVHYMGTELLVGWGAASLRPIVDGWAVLVQPAARVARSRQADVALLAGLNADELSYHENHGRVSREGSRRIVRDAYGDNADTLLAFHR